MVVSNFSIQRERSLRATRHMGMIRLYALNKPVQDIANLYECTRHTVQRLARLAGLPKRPKHFPKQIRKACLTMLKEGRPLAEIQANLGVSQAYASKLAKEHGLSRYKTGKK